MSDGFIIVDPLAQELPRFEPGMCLPSYPIAGTDATSISGLGTRREPDREQLVALRVGRPMRSNAFTYVVPYTEFYEPQVGDVVLGRVRQVLPGKWLLDIRAVREARLKLDSLNLPGLLRQRQTADETNMRLFLDTGELVVVEMRANNQAFTRNRLFGKLSHGQALWFSPRLMTGTNHFVNIDQLSVILGRNGGVWLSNLRTEQESAVQDQSAQDYTDQALALLEEIARFITDLAERGRAVTAAALREEFEARGHTVQVL